MTIQYIHQLELNRVEAHKDENRGNAKVNLTLKQKHFRTYPQLKKRNCKQMG